MKKTTDNALAAAVMINDGRLRTLYVAVVLCALAAGAHAQTRATIAHGQEIAQRLCAGCHAIDGSEGSTIQGTAAPSFRALADRPYQTAESLQAFILTPGHPMPAMPLELAEIRDLVAYIRSLK
jgi:mono/diheme cytochrome c family protein